MHSVMPSNFKRRLKTFAVCVFAFFVMAFCFSRLFYSENVSVTETLKDCKRKLIPLTPRYCPKYCGPDTKLKALSEELPFSATDSLRYFVLFVGHARSGSSITGAVLDAHPHVILSHEYFLARRMAVAPDEYSSKSVIFSELYKNQVWKTRSENVGLGSEKKGYSLAINGSYQGSYDRWISVIGDKSGAQTNWVYMADPKRFAEVVHSIEDTTGLQVKLIHVSL